jgi:hypothetical protein
VNGSATSQRISAKAVPRLTTVLASDSTELFVKLAELENAVDEEPVLCDVTADDVFRCRSRGQFDS